MQFAGQFIVHCLPVTVMYCVSIVYTLLTFVACVCMSVCVSLVCASLRHLLLGVYVASVYSTNM